ncbi:hypothetical protein Hhel01_00288 [Haloferula helveola]
MARWSERREREILTRGIPLEDSLLDFAARLGIPDPGRVRIEVRSDIPLPLPGGVVGFLQRIGIPLFRPAGMALGNGISAIHTDPQLLRHELVHVRQYARLGGHFRFMRQYIYECLRYGYACAPLETEARERAVTR